MPRYDIPKLADYSGAIQANQSMMSAFNNLGNQSRDYLKMEEQKKQNAFDQEEQQKQNSFSNAFKQQELDFKNTQEASKKQANTEALKFVNPELFQSIQSQYGQTPTIENANKMNDITGNIDLDKVKPAKPSYKLEKTDSGFVMFNTANPEAQPIPVGGNYKPYSKPTNVSGADVEKKTTDQLNWLLYNSGRKTKGLEPIAYDEFYDQKMNTKSMGVGLRDANSVEQETGRVAKTLSLSPYQMSSYDFSKLQPEQRYEMDNLITTREQGLKAKVPDWMKKNLDDLSAVVYSAGEVSKNINSNDTGMIDATFNKVNQYLGLGDTGELAKRSLTQSNYQLYSNFMLKSMSGLAVTKPEEERFTNAFGSLILNDNVTAVKIKTNMENLSYRLENMKKSYDPIAFNYRYGHLQKGVQNAISKMDEILQNGSAENKNLVNSDGSKYENKEQNKTVVQTLKNKTTGQIMNRYSDGSESYE